MFVDTLITASPEFFTGRSKKEVQAYFTEAVAFMEKKVGRGNIFSAVVHMDEKTPHLHLCFTPITKDGRLSAKEILGNRAQLSQWQDEFHAYMKKGVPRPQAGRERPCHQTEAHSHMAVQAVRRPDPPAAGHRKGGI